MNNQNIIWRQGELRPGLLVSTMEINTDQDVTLYSRRPSGMIDFGFILGGQFSHTIDSRNTSMKMEVTKGLAGVGFFPERKGVAEIPGGTSIRALHIHMSPERLGRLIRDDINALPCNFQSILKGKKREYLSRGKMTPTIQTTVHELFSERFHGRPMRLYLECKALELVTLQLGNLIVNEIETSGRIRLGQSEEARIREAYEWLMKDLSRPPTLEKIAGRFRMSRNKLQYGFRTLFGDSVFGCLREHKMQRARILFETSDMNVSEVAFEVGYINVSQFSKAFKNRFGIAPKQFSKLLPG